jgi:hypothetical protein
VNLLLHKEGIELITINRKKMSVRSQQEIGAQKRRLNQNTAVVKLLVRKNPRMLSKRTLVSSASRSFIPGAIYPFQRARQKIGSLLVAHLTRSFPQFPREFGSVGSFGVIEIRFFHVELELRH